MSETPSASERGLEVIARGLLTRLKEDKKVRKARWKGIIARKSNDC